MPPVIGAVAWKFVVSMAISYAINVVTSKLFGPKQKSNSPTYSMGALQTQTNSGMAVPLIYGTVKLAGNFIWSGPEGKVQSRLISFGVGKIKGFRDIRLNDIPIADLPGCSYTAYVGDGEQLIDDRVTGATQRDKALLVGGLKYDAYLAITVTAGDKISGNYNVTAIVDGLLVKIYDTATTYHEDWSDNPSWCALDWYTNIDGCDIPVDAIDIQMHITAANYFTPRAWSTNLVLDEKKTLQDWRAELFLTCRSYPTYQRGLHGILVDKAEDVSQIFKVKPTEAIEFALTDLTEDIERIILKYPDPAYEWQFVGAPATILPPFRKSKPLEKTIQIKGITNFPQASQMSRFHVNQAQTCQEKLTYETNKRALNRSIGEVIGMENPITLVHEEGLTYKRYRIMSMGEPQGNKIALGLWEYNPNLYGDTMGSVAPVVNVTKMPNPAMLPPFVTNLSAEEHFRPQGNGTVLNDLLVFFTPPDSSFFSHAEAYLKSNQPAGNELNATGDQFNVPGDQIGDAINVWKAIGPAYGGNILIQNLIKGQEYSIKLVSVSKLGLKSDFDTSPVIKRTILGKTYTPQTPSELTVNITDKCEWTWNPLADDDADFAELRTDQNPGQQTGMLAKTLSVKTTVTPPARQGTVYLYAHNTAGKYSSPCIFGYNKSVPAVPDNVTITDIFQGLVITCDPLPPYCLGINVHVNDGTGDKVYFSPNNSYNFKTTGGIFDIRVAYVDLFGEGILSATVQKTVVATIDPALIAAESLSLAMMDPIIKDAVAIAGNGVSGTVFTTAINQLTQADADHATQISQNAIQITQVATDLGSANTVIAQNFDAIQLRATKANLVALINLSSETITIASKFNHVAGDTLFDDNVIVPRMLSANSVAVGKIDADAVTAREINVTSLSAITATIGTLRTATTGARTEIADNLISVYDANNVLRVRMGVW
jgi:hypothetical protein